MLQWDENSDMPFAYNSSMPCEYDNSLVDVNIFVIIIDSEFITFHKNKQKNEPLKYLGYCIEVIQLSIIYWTRHNLQGSPAIKHSTRISMSGWIFIILWTCCLLDKEKDSENSYKMNKFKNIFFASRPTR